MRTAQNAWYPSIAQETAPQTSHQGWSRYQCCQRGKWHPNLLKFTQHGKGPKTIAKLMGLQFFLGGTSSTPKKSLVNI
jgi:Tfp pilus assembly protein FimT